MNCTSIALQWPSAGPGPPEASSTHSLISHQVVGGGIRRRLKDFDALDMAQIPVAQCRPATMCAVVLGAWGAKLRGVDVQRPGPLQILLLHFG